jgi:hypothetical protein
MSSRLSLAVLLLALALGSPLLASPGSRKEVQRTPAPVQTSSLSSPVTWLWHRLTATWGAEGCGMDPNGAPRCAPTPAGQTAVAAPAPAGCGLDPNGRCSY